MILADTSTILYYLKGMDFLEPYKNELFSIFEISEVELLGVKNISSNDLNIRKQLITQCIIYPFTSDVKKAAIELKQQVKIKIPDAIIAATAIQFNMTLLSSDKDFSRIPYLSLI